MGYMNTKSVIVFVVATIVVLVGVVGLLWQFGGTTASTTKPIADVAGQMLHKQGDGPVVVTEFSDFQCPACQAVHEPLKQLLAKYSGKVTFVYRYFPLTNIHKNAMLSAQAAEAAGRQGKFWEMGDLLFSKQTEWEGIADPHATFIQYAASLGLDQAKFAADLDSSNVKDAVTTDLTAATKYNLQGTPTIFVNGVQTDFANLDAAITQAAK